MALEQPWAMIFIDSMLYILLRLFVGWFPFKLTSYYVCSWGGLVWNKNTPRIYVFLHPGTSVYSWGGFLPNSHPITSTRRVFFVQLYILVRLFLLGVVLELKNTTPRIAVIGCKFVHPVTSIRGVVFFQIHILLRLFVGLFWTGN